MTPESELKKKIKEYLDDRSIYWCMIKGGAHSKPGDPDMIACVNGMFIGIEAKTYEGTQSNIQKLRQRQIEDNGGVYIIARNVDDVAETVNKYYKA